MIENKELLERIYQNSLKGIIPTESESAELKGFFKELRFSEDSDFYSKLQLEFPIEFGEAMDELDSENV